MTPTERDLNDRVMGCCGGFTGEHTFECQVAADAHWDALHRPATGDVPVDLTIPFPTVLVDDWDGDSWVDEGCPDCTVGNHDGCSDYRTASWGEPAPCCCGAITQVAA